jgi:hypothetical protein
MNLDGEWLAREKELQKQSRGDIRRTGTLVPDFADCAVVAARAAPWA